MIKLNLQRFADKLIGKWVFDSRIDNQNILVGTHNISFKSNGKEYKSMVVNYSPFPPLPDGGRTLSYDKTLAFTQYDVSSKNKWENNNFKEIEITDISLLTDKERFTSWLENSATKQEPKPSGKNVKLKNEANEVLYPQTKASLLLNDDGTPYVPPKSELPIASASQLGGVKVGSGLSITSDGTLSSSGGGGGTKLYKHELRINIDGTSISLNLVSTCKDDFNKVILVNQLKDYPYFIIPTPVGDLQGFGQQIAINLYIDKLDDLIVLTSLNGITPNELNEYVSDLVYDTVTPL